MHFCSHGLVLLDVDNGFLIKCSISSAYIPSKLKDLLLCCCIPVLRYRIRHSCPSSICFASQNNQYYLAVQFISLWHLRLNLTCLLSNRSKSSKTLLWTNGFLLYIQLCCCLLFIVREYWRNSTSYTQIYHPHKALLHRLLVVLTTLHRFQTSRFTQPETGEWFHFTICCLASGFLRLSCILTSQSGRTTQICCLSFWLPILLLASQERLALDFPTSPASHTTGAKVFYTFFYYNGYRRTSIFVNNVNIS